MAGCRVRCFEGRHRKQGGTNTHLASPVERDASPWYNAPAKLSLRWAFGNGKGNKIEIRFVLFSICFFSHPSKEGTGRGEATAAAPNTFIMVSIWNNSHRLSVEILVLSRWDPVAEARNFRRWGLAAGNRSPRVVSLEVRPYLGLPSCNSLLPVYHKLSDLYHVIFLILGPESDEPRTMFWTMKLWSQGSSPLLIIAGILHSDKNLTNETILLSHWLP